MPTQCLMLSLAILLVSGQNYENSIESQEEDMDECVPITNCNEYNQGESVVMFKQLDITHIEDSNCTNYLEVRCRKKFIVNNTSSVPQTFLGCGLRNPSGLGFSLTNHDLESEFGEFPWMIDIAIKYQSEPWLRSIAGGSLIHPSVVLTAAHQVYDKDPTKINVRAGEWDKYTEYEPFLHEDRNVIKIIVHQEFSNITLRNDIALLIVETPFILTSHIHTICLPNLLSMVNDTDCYVSGWGVKAENYIRAHFLKKIDVSLIDHKTCRRMLRKNTTLGRSFSLHTNFLCAGGIKGKDACTGDGGSPLICPHSTNINQYYQVGIVSWGMECGKSDVPGVYINTAKLREWINTSLWNENIDNIYMDP